MFSDEKNGRSFAYYIGKFDHMFPKNVIRASLISKDSECFSYEEAKKRIGYHKFSMSDMTKQSYHSLVTNEQEFNDVLRNNPHSIYFHIYKYIEGKKLSFSLKQEVGMISDKKISEIEERIKKLVIGGLHYQILDIIKKTARFLYDDQFIHDCNFKIKFIISTDFKVYVYKIYILDDK